jgi:hypothetical protein
MEKYKIVRKVGRKWAKSEVVELTDQQALYWASLGVVKLTEEQKNKYYSDSFQVEDKPGSSADYADPVTTSYQPPRDFGEAVEKTLEQVKQNFVSQADLDATLQKFQANILSSLKDKKN